MKDVCFWEEKKLSSFILQFFFPKTVILKENNNAKIVNKNKIANIEHQMKKDMMQYDFNVRKRNN